MFPKKAIRWCLSVVIVLLFLVSLFAFVGMPIYSAIVGVSYAQGWDNLLEAIRAVAN